MPCWAKFLEVWILNSVQSTLHRIFFMVLKTLGRNLCNVSLVGNTTSSISLKILYINFMNVGNISRTAVPFIGLSGIQCLDGETRIESKEANIQFLSR